MLLLIAGSAAGANVPGEHAVLAACLDARSEGSISRPNPEDVIDVFARGGVEVATACRPALRRAVLDTGASGLHRWRALEALARVTTLESDMAAIAEVQQALDSLAEEADSRAIARRVRSELGIALNIAGEATASATLLEAAHAEMVAAGAPQADILRTRLFLAWTRVDSGRAAAGRELALTVLQGRQALFGDDHAETNLARINLASMAYAAADYTAADPHYVEAARRLAATLGLRHPYTLRAQRGQAMVAMARGRFAQALSIAEGGLLQARVERPADDPEVLVLSTLLAYMKMEAGDAAAAHADLQRVIPQLVTRYGEGDDRTLRARDALSWVCLWLGDSRCALVESERTLLGYARMAEATDTRRLRAQAKYAIALTEVGRVDDGLQRLARAVAVGLQAHGPHDRTVSALLVDLGLAYLRNGRPREAVEPLSTAVHGRAVGDNDWPNDRLLAARYLAAAWLETGEPRLGLELLETTLLRLQGPPGSSHYLRGVLVAERARARLALGQPAAALDDAEEALSSLAAARGATWTDRFAARATRAAALAALGRTQESLDERRAFVRDVEAVRNTLDDSPAVRQSYLREWIPQYKQLALEACLGRRHLAGLQRVRAGPIAHPSRNPGVEGR